MKVAIICDLSDSVKQASLPHCAALASALVRDKHVMVYNDDVLGMNGRIAENMLRAGGAVLNIAVQEDYMFSVINGERMLNKLPDYGTSTIVCRTADDQKEAILAEMDAVLVISSNTHTVTQIQSMTDKLVLAIPVLNEATLAHAVGALNAGSSQPVRTLEPVAAYAARSERAA